MIVHTSAIVFKAIDYGETSKIVTLFSEEHGKIAVMVKGAKKPKNKFSGLIEAANLLDVVYYHKSSRSVQILTEASLMENLLNLRRDFRKMATATSAIELTSQLLHENEVNKPVFAFFKNFLIWLDETEHSPPTDLPLSANTPQPFNGTRPSIGDGTRGFRNFGCPKRVSKY